MKEDIFYEKMDFVVNCFCDVFLMVNPAMATEESEWIDSVDYIEEGTGDEITLAVLMQSAENSCCVTAVYRNGVLEETLYIDLADDVLEHVYADGMTVSERVSDVVEIETITGKEHNAIMDADESIKDIEYTSTGLGDVNLPMNTRDYLTNEPFEINSNGIQENPPRSTYYDSYWTLCSDGNFPEYPGIYGYLSRKNRGIYTTSYAHNFQFSAGTSLSTGVAILVTFATATNLPGLTVGVATALLGPVFELLTYDWSTQFEVVTYRWDYRVNLGSYSGTTIFETSRLRDYFKVYTSTGKVNYEYRGAAFDGGFLSTNQDLIYDAIRFYMGD